MRARRGGDRGWWSAVVAITLVAAVVRLIGLGAQPLWEDEAQTYWIAARPLAEIPQLLSRDCSPPLYYVLLHVWIMRHHASEAWLRFPSALFGVVAVPLVALAARRLGGNRWVSVGAALVLTVSPLHLWHSQETRMYTLLVVLALASGWSLHFWRRGGHWLPFVLSSTLALSTHHFALYLVAAEVLWLAIKGAPRSWRVAAPVFLALYAPTAWLLWTQVVVNRTGGWIGRTPWDALPRTFGLLSLGVHADERLVVAGVPLLLVLGGAVFAPAFVVGALWWLKRCPLLVWLSLTVPVLAFVSSQFVPSYTTGRYDVVILAFYLLVVAGSMTRGRRFFAVAALIVAAEAVPVVHYHRHYRKSASREVAREVTTRERPDDLVVIAPEIHHSPFKYYYGGSLPVLPLTGGAPGGVVDYSHYARRWEAGETRRALRAVGETYRGGKVFLVWSPYKETLAFRDGLLTRFHLAERLVYRTGSGYLELNVLEPRPRSRGAREQGGEGAGY